MSKQSNNKEVLAFIWQEISEKKQLLRQVGLDLGMPTGQVYLLYKKAEKIYGCKTTLKQRLEDAAVKPAFVRPPSEYSNKSPYQIARPGITK